MRPEDIEEIDPGLARARTELAWTRTAISFAALGGMTIRTTPVVGGLILASSTLIFMLSRIARPDPHISAHGRSGPLMLIMVSVTLIAVVALAVAVFGAQ